MHRIRLSVIAFCAAQLLVAAGAQGASSVAGAVTHTQLERGRPASRQGRQRALRDSARNRQPERVSRRADHDHIGSRVDELGQHAARHAAVVGHQLIIGGREAVQVRPRRL